MLDFEHFSGGPGRGWGGVLRIQLSFINSLSFVGIHQFFIIRLKTSGKKPRLEKQIYLRNTSFRSGKYLIKLFQVSFLLPPPRISSVLPALFLSLFYTSTFLTDSFVFAKFQYYEV